MLAWVCTRSIACMLWIIAWCFHGNPNSGYDSHTFACFGDCIFLLGCLAQPQYKAFRLVTLYLCLLVFLICWVFFFCLFACLFFVCCVVVVVVSWRPILCWREIENKLIWDKERWEKDKWSRGRENWVLDEWKRNIISIK